MSLCQYHLWLLRILSPCFLVFVIPYECITNDSYLQSSTSESLLRISNISENNKVFLKQIFEKYGHNGVLTLDGFENLLENVGLNKATWNGHDANQVESENLAAHVHSSDVQHSDIHGSPERTSVRDDVTSGDEIKNANLGSKLHNNERHETLLTKEHDSDGLVSSHSKCLNPTEMMSFSQIDPLRGGISTDNFANVCPVIIYELNKKHCRSTLLEHKHGDNHVVFTKSSVSYRKAWIYSSLAVMIISLTGMLSVAVVPVIQKFYYHQLLHYFVALAIGSLTGDALLHLLPHAMSTTNCEHVHSNLDEDHQGSHNHTNIALGFTALAGICLFFTAERLLSMVASHRQNQAKMRYTDEQKLQLAEKAKHTKSSYGYQYGEVPAVLQGLTEKVDDDVIQGNCAVNGTGTGAETELPMGPLCSATVVHANSQNCSFDLPNESNNMNGVKVITAGHEVHHRGHSHSHSHEVPHSVSAMAWMVIAGDGLHNLSDGMAIGAAFASSLTGGFSTAVAVFCHELPHELGDFALLLKAGMGTRQALLYNALSSFLCFIGMLIGLAIGNIASANSWIFAGVAGMFLYIALVDMVPELNSDSGVEFSGLKKLVVQALGIATGIVIMCLIAVYEHDLQNLFA